MSKEGKGRYWACVVYPESAPEGWREMLAKTGLRVAISPLHDSDLDPTGEPKKPHWHVIMCWDGPASRTVVQAITTQLCAPAPEQLRQVRGYYRYLTHADNPDKHQYDAQGIVHMGGFDHMDYIEWTRSELERYKRDILRIIREHNVLEYADLLDMLDADEHTDLLSVAMSQTILFRAYISSRRHMAGGPDVRVDEATGEVIE